MGKRIFIILLAALLSMGLAFFLVKYGPGIYDKLTNKKEVGTLDVPKVEPAVKVPASNAVTVQDTIVVKEPERPQTKRVLYAARRKGKDDVFDPMQDATFVEIPAGDVKENYIVSLNPRSDNDIKRMYESVVILEDLKLRQPITLDMLGEHIDALKSAGDRFRDTITGQPNSFEMSADEIRYASLSVSDRYDIVMQAMDGDALVRLFLVSGVELKVHDEDPNDLVYFVDLSDEDASRLKKARALMVARTDVRIGLYPADLPVNREGDVVCVQGRCYDMDTERSKEFSSGSLIADEARLLKDFEPVEAKGPVTVGTVSGAKKMDEDVDKLLDELLRESK